MTASKAITATFEYIKAVCRYAATGEVHRCEDRPNVLHVLSGEDELDRLKDEARQAVRADKDAPQALRDHICDARGPANDVTFEHALAAIVSVLAPDVPHTPAAMGPWIAAQAQVARHCECKPIGLGADPPLPQMHNGFCVQCGGPRS